MKLHARWGRLSFGLQATLAALLAGGAALLAVDVADWHYVRVDLSRTGRNTLDPALLDLIDGLPDPAVVDVFVRPLSNPYRDLSLHAAQRTVDLLSVARSSRRERFEVRVHDPADFEKTRERQRELGVEGENIVVVSCGERHTELALFGELCVIDWGNPTEENVRYLLDQGLQPVDPRTWNPDVRAFRPAMLREFRGEEALAQALLKVSAGTPPRVYFAEGQGEPALDGSQQAELGQLRAALVRDGFEVATWDPLKVSSVPADCAVLALIGPRQPYGDRTREAIRAYAEGGGRVLAAPDVSEQEPDREGGVTSVLREFGMLVLRGIVCLPIRGAAGEDVDGDPYCALLVIDENRLQASHPLTEPLRRRGRRVQFRSTPALELETGKGVLPLVSTMDDAWRDLFDARGQLDYRFNAAAGEQRERLYLAAVRDLRATKDTATGAVRQGRVVGIASALFFANVDFNSNRDFILNAFNWLAEREYRMAVAPLDRSTSFLDLERGNDKPVLVYSLWLALPGLSALIGGIVFLRRRS